MAVKMEIDAFLSPNQQFQRSEGIKWRRLMVLVRTVMIVLVDVSDRFLLCLTGVILE